MRASPSSLPEIAGYEGLELIGHGGFAVVYRAQQTAFGRPAAVKVLAPAGRLEPALGEERFRRECLAVGALSWHPNIVTVYDAGSTSDQRFYLAMELVDGGTLADRLAREGRLGWVEVAAIGVKLAGALEAAHRSRRLHRDIKPENILVGDLGEPKLADFGIAAVVDHSTYGPRAFSPLHAPPEIFDGRRATVASDLYSLGSTLHHLLAGTAPFERPGDDGAFLALMARVTADKPPDLRALGVHPILAEVIDQSLEKEPASRPPNALEFGRRLQRAEVEGGEPGTLMRVSPDEVVRPRRAGRERLRTDDRAGVDRPGVAPSQSDRSAVGGADLSTTNVVHFAPPPPPPATEDIRAEAPPDAPPVVGPTSRPAHVGRHRRWSVPVTAVFAATAIGVVAVWLGDRSSVADRPTTVPAGASSTTSAPAPAGASVFVDAAEVRSSTGDDVIMAVAATGDGSAVAVGSVNSAVPVPRVWRLDGGAWTEHPRPPAGPGVMVSLAPAAVGAAWVAGGWTSSSSDAGGVAGPGGRQATVWLSDDAATWEPVTVGPPGVRTEIGDIISRTDGSLLAVGVDEGADPAGDGAVWRSDDGRSWAQVETSGLSGVGPQGLHRVVETVDGLVAVGSRLVGAIEGPVILTSVDGVEWQVVGGEIEPGETIDVRGLMVLRDGSLLAGGGRQLPGGDAEPRLWRSVDGSSWEALTIAGAPGAVVEGVGTQDGTQLAVGADDASGMRRAAIYTFELPPRPG